MSRSKTRTGLVLGKNVRFGTGVLVWNYVVVGDNTMIGDGTAIGSFCDIGRDVVIGKGCSIQAHVTISNGCKVGNSVFIAPNSSLLNDKYPRSNIPSPVTVEDNVVIGGAVTILPGLVVGQNSVVGAGSLVTKDIPPETVVMGAPARIVMSLEEYLTKRNAFIKPKRSTRT